MTAPVADDGPELRCRQHIAWIKMYADTMTPGNWRDLRDRILHQVRELSQDFAALAAPQGAGDAEVDHMVATLRDRGDKLCSDAADTIERLSALGPMDSAKDGEAKRCDKHDQWLVQDASSAWFCEACEHESAPDGYVLMRKDTWQEIVECINRIDAALPAAPLPANTGGKEVSANQRLAELLRALAGDCRKTDGWQTAAPDLEQAATELTRLSAEVAALEDGLLVQKNTIASQQNELVGLYAENAALRKATIDLCDEIEAEGHNPKTATCSICKAMARALAATAGDDR